MIYLPNSVNSPYLEYGLSGKAGIAVADIWLVRLIIYLSRITSVSDKGCDAADPGFIFVLPFLKSHTARMGFGEDQNAEQSGFVVSFGAWKEALAEAGLSLEQRRDYRSAFLGFCEPVNRRASRSRPASEPYECEGSSTAGSTAPFRL